MGFFKTDRGRRIHYLRQQLAKYNEVIFEYEWRIARPEASFLPSSPAAAHRVLQQIEEEIEFLELKKQVRERQEEFQKLVREREKYLQQLRQQEQVRGQGSGGPSNS